MDRQTEIELKFRVLPGARRALVAALTQGATAPVRSVLAAQYLDTPDRRLAQAGLAWRLRREGRRWVQTLKAGGASPLERFEHEVVRPAALAQPELHAGTPAGERLLDLLRQAKADGREPTVRWRTQVRRLARRVRTRGAVVEIAFDEGRIEAADASLPLCEIEFELVSGSALAMLALAERWRARFGLVLDPRSKAERGDRLATGTAQAAVRKAARLRYDADANAIEAFGAVFDECLAHIGHNAIGLIDGDGALQGEHVHQLRVGIRRLRSALRGFRGWVPPLPQESVAGLRALFATLGQSRDAEVLAGGVAAQLVAAGAPALPQAAALGFEPAQALRADAAQRLLLGLIAWREALPALAQPPADSALARAWPRAAARRLRRWHARIGADAKAFDQLDAAGLHALRKRVKRQRYAVEFFAPWLRGRRRYLDALAAAQERMGALNDLFVARERCGDNPFALGWLAARIVELRGLAKPAVERLARTPPPKARGS